MRITLLAIAAVLLTGCSAMMLGGENSGGYQAPTDECSGEERDSEGCRS